VTKGDASDSPEPRPPIDLTCARCRRVEPLPLYAETDVRAGALTEWHETEREWICGHCWTGLDHRREQQLCIRCGRDARGGENKREEWGPRHEDDALECPQCRVAPDDSVKVQLTKEVVCRWRRAGAFPDGYECLVDDALRRERKIVEALLRRQVEREGTTPTDDEWDGLVSRAVDAARAAWPEPVGQHKTN
jgi:DNA-directed RNA polymerase subunit RPC12/RpoP